MTRLLLLTGDGIGPEIMEPTLDILRSLQSGDSNYAMRFEEDHVDGNVDHGVFCRHLLDVLSPLSQVWFVFTFGVSIVFIGLSR